MLPLLDSLLGWRLMFLVSSTAMPVSVLLWIGAPFSFLLFPSGWNRRDRKNYNAVVRHAVVGIFYLYLPRKKVLFFFLLIFFTLFAQDRLNERCLHTDSRSQNSWNRYKSQPDLCQAHLTNIFVNHCGGITFFTDDDSISHIERKNRVIYCCRNEAKQQLKTYSRHNYKQKITED